MTDDEKITGVALLNKYGRLWSLPRPHRHFHLFALAAFCNQDPEPCKQGFTTNKGRFVDRKEARRIAEDQMQIQVGANKSEILYSEDLW